MTRLGERLKSLRGDFSINEVAREMDMAPIILSRYENGKTTPSPEMLKRLAEYYGVSYDELRELYYDDYFSNLEERRIVLNWAKKQLSEQSY